jgi:predicted AAA+ superfamily ATPase
MKDLFKRLITESIEKDYPDLKERELEIPVQINKIITIIGARRSGKSYYLYSIIVKLRKTIKRELLVYINFDDDRLFPLELKSLNDFIEGYYEMYPENRNEKVYFFLDEIQNITNWELFIRRIFDKENCYIYLTGSSSKLLSKEIATSLRGRTIVYEIFPLSFNEFLSWKAIKNVEYSIKAQSVIINAFDKYNSASSFPELFNFSGDAINNVLHEYINMVIYKDLIERYQLSNHYLIKYFVKFLLNNTGNLLSINKVYNDFKSLGLKVAKQSLYQYIDYLEDAYIFYSVPVFTNNIREKNRNPQKIYCVDNGLKELVSITKDSGKLYENLVFLQLRRKYTEISYFKQIQEVDFCFYNTNKEIELINVCFSLSDNKAKLREINGLQEAMKALNVNKSILINNNLEKDLIFDNKTIKVIPLWKWLTKFRTGELVNL